MGVQFYRLWPRRPRDGSLPLGLSCDDEGLLIAGNCRLIEAALDREGRRFYRVRAVEELSAVLSAGYELAVDASSLHPALERVAEHMTSRDWTRASIAALHLRLPELADGAAAQRVLKADAILKWNPALHPRWPEHSAEGHGGQFRPKDGDDGSLLVPVSDSGKEPNSGAKATRKLEVQRDRWIFRTLRALRRTLGRIEFAKKIIDAIGDLDDIISTLDRISPELKRSLDPPKDLDELRADKEFRSFPSFQEFKDYYGSAGEGSEWHHIVEQSADFPPEKVNTTENIIRVPKFIHEEVNGILSTKVDNQDFTFRDLTHQKSFADQREYGLALLKDFGVIK